MKLRNWIAGTSAGALAAVVAVAAPAFSSPVDGQVISPATANRVEVFAGDDRPAIDAATREVLGEAYGLSREHPREFAPPFVRDGRVVFSPVSAAGQRMLDDRGWATAVSRAPAPHSLAELDAIKHEVIGLSLAELPGSRGIHTTLVQAHRNRVVVESTSAPDELRVALAQRYGPQRIAIRLTPSPARSQLAVDGRLNDNSNFEGGSEIRPSEGPCTSGFPWYAASYGDMMLTAGHCTTAGGSDVYTPNGTKYGDTRQDYWWNGHGSSIPDGQCCYRGDISLIEIASGQVASNSIHIGGVTSTSSRRVAGIYSRYQQPNDLMCIGGKTTGEHCQWLVTDVHIDHRYDSGSLLRNAFRVSRNGGCIDGGDSGAPMYIYNANSLIVATGILSGGRREAPCVAYGTDIRDAYLSMPGSVKT